MNNKISFKRIGWILRADWIENKRMFAISSGLFLIVYLLLMWQPSLKAAYSFFWVGIVITLINYFSFVKRKVHRPRGLSLTLPASTLEKFIGLLIVGVCYLLVFNCVYWLAVTLWHLLAGSDMITVSGLLEKASKAPGFLVFLTSYLLVCYMTLKKYPVGIGFAALILFCVLLGRIYAFFLPGLFADKQSEVVQSDIIAATAEFLFTNFNVAMYIASVVLLYVAYLKLKEKQIK